MHFQKLSFLIALLLIQSISAQDVLKTMTYNLLNFPTAPPSNRTEILQDILLEYEPDLLMVNELETQVGGEMILNESILPVYPDFERSLFIPIQSDPDTDNPLQNMVFYNTKKLILENEEIYKTTVRDISRYTFLLNTDDQEDNPVRLEVFLTHLKSSTGTTNNQLRLAMVETFMDALENEYADDETHEPIAPDSYVIFAGDMNFYSSSEPGYQKLRNDDESSLRTFVDVLNPDNELQSWTGNNPDWHSMHTQATRVNQFGGYGASSGLDDRFDFVFFSENLFDNPELEYVEGTYAAYGNNGNCHDKDINDPDCEGEYSLELRDNLWYMSDHLPVVMELQTEQTFLDTPNYSQKPLIWFPNGNTPTANLSIAVDVSIAETITFDIFNVLGQNIITLKNNKKSTYLVDVSHLKSGVYYIQTNLGTSYKFIKKN